MALHYEDGQTQLHHGDCREVLASLPDCSVDSVVTDPPYELGFMGKAWDGSGIAYSVEMWGEVLRVLKPGGHLCAFGGTRTYHRMACAIEDAGFEIRDSLHWVYGSGFPKSLDVSKAIDKAAGAEREVVGKHPSPGSTKPRTSMGDGWQTDPDITTAATDAAKQWQGWGTALKPAHEPIVLARKPLIGTVAANVLTHGTGALNIDGARVGTDGGTSGGVGSGSFRFHGFTSLAELQRAASNGEKCPDGRDAATTLARYEESVRNAGEITATGRWPANVIFDTEAGALLDEQADGASRFFTAIEWDDNTDIGIDVPFRYVPKPSKRERNAGLDGLPVPQYGGVGVRGHDPDPYPVRIHNPNPIVIAEYLRTWREKASMSKAAADEAIGGTTLYSWFEGRPKGIQLPTPEMWLRLKKLFGFDDIHDEQMTATHLVEKSGFENSKPTANHHPTVKPLALMRWLVKLVTPPGGTVLEPFAGSGTTLMACVMEGFNGIGIEMTDEYLPIIEGRVKWAHDNQPTQEELPL